jgi:hypothetical protein
MVKKPSHATVPLSVHQYPTSTYLPLSGINAIFKKLVVLDKAVNREDKRSRR